MLPDSKLAAVTVFPGYWFPGAGAPGWQVAADAGLAPTASPANTRRLSAASTPVRRSFSNDPPAQPMFEIRVEHRLGGPQAAVAPRRRSTAVRETLFLQQSVQSTGRHLGEILAGPPSRPAPGGPAAQLRHRPVRAAAGKELFREQKTPPFLNRNGGGIYAGRADRI